MLDKIKRLFGYVKIDEIKIYREFEEHPPRMLKMALKREYYNIMHKFEQPIVLNCNNWLEDGYTSYLIAKEHNYTWIRVKRI